MCAGPAFLDHAVGQRLNDVTHGSRVMGQLTDESCHVGSLTGHKIRPVVSSTSLSGYVPGTWVRACTWTWRLILFQRFVSHVNTLKRNWNKNNFTETKHCFAFVLFQFYFIYNQWFRPTVYQTIRYRSQGNKRLQGALFSNQGKSDSL